MITTRNEKKREYCRDLGEGWGEKYAQNEKIGGQKNRYQCLIGAFLLILVLLMLDMTTTMAGLAIGIRIGARVLPILWLLVNAATLALLLAHSLVVDGLRRPDDVTTFGC